MAERPGLHPQAFSNFALGDEAFSGWQSVTTPFWPMEMVHGQVTWQEWVDNTQYLNQMEC